ncbi:MAG: hypothetical protein U5K81_11905 [Trueperaceae bacterium]|nr:hypothetical protein [Trueperaceae bacterium]
MGAYLLFAVGFTAIHAAAYVLAGVVALAVSKDLYAAKDRVLDFLHDMSDPVESRHVQRTFLPAQLLRGLLMAVVLFPVLGALSEMSFALRTVFFASLTFVYLEVASSIPFSTNIEGYVYMKARYRRLPSVWKLYLEVILYSLLLGFAASWLLF